MSDRRKNRRRGGASSAAQPGANEASAGAASEPLRFTSRTAVYGGAGLVAAGVGFFLLSRGSITLAPILLLVAFLICFPLALTK